MDKKIKVFVLAAMTVVLLVGGFFLSKKNTGGANSVNSVGGDYHYVLSEPMTFPGGEKLFYTMLTDKENQPIYMVDTPEGCFVYRGLGDRQKAISPNVTAARKDLEVKGFTMDQESNLYVLYGVFRGKEAMNIYDRKGNLVKEDIPLEGDLTEIKYMNFYNGKLYILDYDLNFQVHTPDGRLTNDNIDLQGIRSVDMDNEGNLYFLIVSPGVHRLVKLESGTNKQVFAVDLPIPIQNVVKYGRGDDLIYTTDGKFLYQFDQSGSLLKKELEFAADVSLVFGRFNDIEIPGMGGSLDNILWDNEGNCYLLANGRAEKNTQLYQLARKSGSKPPEAPKEEIVLTAAYEQDFIATAIGIYNIQSEKYKVVLDAAYGSYDEFMNHDVEAGEKLALRIMTNDVGDIVATGGNGLNYYDVLRTDAFMDLSELIAGEESYHEQNSAVLKGLTLNGHLKGLPIGAAYYRLIYNKALGESLGLNPEINPMKWSEILKLALQLEKQGAGLSVFSTQENGFDTYFTLMLQANMPDLIDIENKKVDLKQGWFLDLLTDFKAASMLSTFMTYRPYDGGNLTGDNALFYFNNLRGNFSGEAMDNTVATSEVVHLPIFSGEKSRSTIAFPVVMYSISNSSKQKEGAWDFLSFLMKSDIQCLTGLNAHPVNLKAEEKLRAHYGITGQRAQEHDQIIRQVDFMYDMSYYKEDIMVPVTAYFNGETSLEAAIEKAEHNVWLRLNE